MQTFRWFHNGKEITLRELAEGETADMGCKQCRTFWALEPRSDLWPEQLEFCPRDFQAGGGLMPTEGEAAGLLVPLREDQRRPLILEWLRTPEAAKDLAEWLRNSGRVYYVAGTWPDVQIQASLAAVASLLDVPPPPPEVGRVAVVLP